jgi:hypothetical protein
VHGANERSFPAADDGDPDAPSKHFDYGIEAHVVFLARVVVFVRIVK